MNRTISRFEILGSICLLFVLAGLFGVVGHNVAHNDEAMLGVLNDPVPQAALALQDRVWDFDRRLEVYIYQDPSEASLRLIQEGLEGVQKKIGDVMPLVSDSGGDVSRVGADLSVLRPLMVAANAIEKKLKDKQSLSPQDTSDLRVHADTMTDTARYFVRSVYNNHHGDLTGVLVKTDKDEALWIVLAILVVGGALALIILQMRTSVLLRKNAETAWAMDRYNALFAAALESTQVGVLIRDMQKLEKPVVFLNKSFTAMTGNDIDYMRNRSSDVLFGWHTQGSAIEAIHETIRTHRAGTFNLQIYRRDGSSFWGEWHLSPVLGKDEKLTHYVSLITDVTALKQAQEGLLLAKESAERASAVKSNFLATMSHEIRTPINGMLGVLDILSDTALNEDQRKLLETAWSSGHALHDIINDILDYAKMEAGKIELSLQPFSLRAVMKEVLDVTWPLASRKGIELNLEVDADVPDCYVSDPGRIRQVVLNLVSNGIKFTEKGGVTIRIHFLLTQENEDKNEVALLRFEVVDTGIGIGGADQGKLFQEFSQIEQTYTRRFGGTGLGLAISRRLVTMMNGEIGVDSKANQGSTFWFVLPLPIAAEGAVIPLLDRRAFLGKKELAPATPASAPVSAPASVPPAVPSTAPSASPDESRGAVAPETKLEASEPAADKPAAKESEEPKPDSEPKADEAEAACANTSGLAVLLVEDNETNRLVGTRYLQKVNIVPDIATNGRDAVEAARNKAYDLILMDISMPEMDGLEASHLIRTKGMNGSRVPIIALTAHVMPGDREKFLDAGMNDHLHKPLRYDMLIEVISRWVRLPQTQEATPSPTPPSPTPLTQAPAPAQEPPPVAAPAAPPAAQAPIDYHEAPDVAEKVLKHLAKDLGGSAVWRITGVFLRDSAQRIAPLLSGEITDPAAIREIAHTIKGSGASCGLSRLAVTMQALEYACTSADAEKMKAILAEVPQIYQAGCSALEKARTAYAPAQA